ncbi:MAG TPA: polysaccharide deacetylase family protein [Candidatus Aquicultor sp.]|jgi:peptidoglycan/xylan/chitin deacetylase (PgdA/CDA1 family)
MKDMQKKGQWRAYPGLYPAVILVLVLTMLSAIVVLVTYTDRRPALQKAGTGAASKQQTGNLNNKASAPPKKTAKTGSSANSGQPQIIPVLCYHHIVNDPKNKLAVPPALLEQHLKFLRASGYQGISLKMLKDNLEHGKALPQKPILLTFDDGWKDQSVFAVPILNKYKFGATFFVYDEAITWNGSDFMTRADLLRLKSLGYDIASHTWSHPSLIKRASETYAAYVNRMNIQLKRSKLWLEQTLKQEIYCLAYPYGLYDSVAVKAAADAGYKLAFTVNGGVNYQGGQSKLLLKRIIVTKYSSPDMLARKLNVTPFHVLKCSPEDGAYLATTAPIISARLSGLNDVDTRTIHFAIDYRGAATTYTVAEDHLSAAISSHPAVKPGFHFLSIEGRGKRGNIYNTTWGFYVAKPSVTAAKTAPVAINKHTSPAGR